MHLLLILQLRVKHFFSVKNLYIETQKFLVVYSVISLYVLCSILRQFIGIKWELNSNFIKYAAHNECVWKVSVLWWTKLEEAYLSWLLLGVVDRSLLSFD